MELIPRWRGQEGGLQQLDFEVLPGVVRGGEENVLVARGKLRGSEGARYVVRSVRSFLGVQTHDVVEMAADVVALDQRVLYVRSIHKETSGIYDAWDAPQDVHLAVDGLDVVLTCRVCGPDASGDDEAVFHGLIRVTLVVTLN